MSTVYLERASGGIMGQGILEADDDVAVRPVKPGNILDEEDEAAVARV